MNPFHWFLNRETKRHQPQEPLLHLHPQPQPRPQAQQKQQQQRQQPTMGIRSSPSKSSGSLISSSLSSLSSITSAVFRNSLNNADSGFANNSSSCSSHTHASENDSADSPQFVYLGGRKFYDEECSPYVLPLDEVEIDRVQQQHFALKHICNGRNYTAPLAKVIKPGSKILDLACGPGQWSFEIAQEFPDAQVYGIDLCGNFPAEIKPKNCKFIIGDVLKGLPWEDEFFDFVWIRYLSAAIKGSNWQQLMQEVKRVLKPGGFIEHHECDIAFNPGPRYNKIQKYVRQAFTERGLNLRFARQLAECISDAGFENINASYISMAHGKWGGRIGQVWAENMHDVYLAIKPWLSQMLDWNDREYDKTIKAIFEKEVEEYHTFNNHHIVWARKKC